MTEATTPTTQQAPAKAWRPTQRQIEIAAMTFARVDQKNWNKLSAMAREDMLIDAHHALVEAYKVAGIPDTMPAGVVCMNGDHARAYADLFRICDETQRAIDAKRLTDIARLNEQRGLIVLRIRGLAASDG